METLKDIFVPYDIAVQLKEIGFDEPCMTGYFNGNLHIDFKKKTNAQTIDLEEIDFSDFNNWENHYSAPTWEQVFDWFRSKNFYFSIFHSYEESESWYNVIHIEFDFYKDVDLEDKDSDGHYYYDISEGIKGNFKEVREKMIKITIEMYENFIHEKNFLKNGKKSV